MGRRAPGRAARVVIRHPEASDADAFVRAVRASRRLHRPWMQLAETPDDFDRLLERQRASTDEVFLIVRREDEALAGFATLGQIHLGALRSAYLGYAAFVPFDGQGYMTEGLALVLRTAFGPLGLHRVEANVQPGNERSIALVERLGFRHEGYSPRYLKVGNRWRDHVRFAILAEEFSPARVPWP